MTDQPCEVHYANLHRSGDACDSESNETPMRIMQAGTYKPESKASQYYHNTLSQCKDEGDAEVTEQLSVCNIQSTMQMIILLLLCTTHPILGGDRCAANPAVMLTSSPDDMRKVAKVTSLHYRSLKLLWGLHLLDDGRMVQKPRPFLCNYGTILRQPCLSVA